MLRLLVVLGLLVPGMALAQDVPKAAQMGMWCGTAFELMARDAPSDATKEKLDAAKVYADGATRLIEDATQAYLEAGYTDQALAAYRQKLETEINPVVNGTGGGGDASYSFQDCSALIGQ